MEIAFLMDRLESINPVNETISHLMYECNERWQNVYGCVTTTELFHLIKYHVS